MQLAETIILVQLADPINLWVGLIPSLVLYAVWQSLRTADRPFSTGTGKMLFDRLGTGRAVFASGLFALSALAMLAWALLVFRPLHRERVELRTWIAFVLLLALALALKWFQTRLYCSMSSRLRTDKPSAVRLFESLLAKLVMASWAALITLNVLQAYVLGLYPQLPQRYGFGKPSLVRLVVDPRMVPRDLLREESVAAEPPQVTRKILLLYRTNQEYIVRCEQCGIKTISLSGAAVFGTIWNESSPSKEDLR